MIINIVCDNVKITDFGSVKKLEIENPDVDGTDYKEFLDFLKKKKYRNNM